jgi:hypothetical protein
LATKRKRKSLASALTHPATAAAAGGAGGYAYGHGSFGKEVDKIELAMRRGGKSVPKGGYLKNLSAPDLKRLAKAKRLKGLLGAGIFAAISAAAMKGLTATHKKALRDQGKIKG